MDREAGMDLWAGAREAAIFAASPAHNPTPAWTTSGVRTPAAAATDVPILAPSSAFQGCPHGPQPRRRRDINERRKGRGGGQRSNVGGRCSALGGMAAWRPIVGGGSSAPGGMAARRPIVGGRYAALGGMAALRRESVIRPSRPASPLPPVPFFPLIRRRRGCGHVDSRGSKQRDSLRRGRPSACGQAPRGEFRRGSSAPVQAPVVRRCASDRAGRACQTGSACPQGRQARHVHSLFTPRTPTNPTKRPRC